MYTHRDVWLHRGQTLNAMDYYHCARYAERTELPHTRGPNALLRTVGVHHHHFAGHYAASFTHAQVPRQMPNAVQLVGPHGRRSNTTTGGGATPWARHTTTRSCTVLGQMVECTR